MKRTFRLHYRIVDGLAPNDHDRNYLCFSLIEPHTEAVKTLALDEDIFKKIVKRCRTKEEKLKLRILISTAAHAAIKTGKNTGSFTIAV